MKKVLLVALITTALNAAVVIGVGRNYFITSRWAYEINNHDPEACNCEENEGSDYYYNVCMSGALY